eukprot:gene1997-33420_t
MRELAFARHRSPNPRLSVASFPSLTRGAYCAPSAWTVAARRLGVDSCDHHLLKLVPSAQQANSRINRQHSPSPSPSSVSTCPLDRKPLPRSLPSLKVSSPVLYRVWNGIQLRCPYSYPNNCPWTGTGEAFSEHLGKCKTKLEMAVSSLGARQSHGEQLSKRLQKCQQEKQQAANELEQCKQAKQQVANELEQCKQAKQQVAVELQKCQQEKQQSANELEQCKQAKQQVANELEQCKQAKQQGAVQLQKCQQEKQQSANELEQCKQAKREGVVQLQKCQQEKQQSANELEQCQQKMWQFKEENQDASNELEQCQQQLQRWKQQENGLEQFQQKVQEWKKQEQIELLRCHQENQEAANELEQCQQQLQQCRREKQRVANEVEQIKEEKQRAENESTREVLFEGGLALFGAIGGGLVGSGLASYLRKTENQQAANELEQCRKQLLQCKLDKQRVETELAMNNLETVVQGGLALCGAIGGGLASYFWGAPPRAKESEAVKLLQCRQQHQGKQEKQQAAKELEQCQQQLLQCKEKNQDAAAQLSQCKLQMCQNVLENQQAADELKRCQQRMQRCKREKQEIENALAQNSVKVMAQGGLALCEAIGGGLTSYFRRAPPPRPSSIWLWGWRYKHVLLLTALTGLRMHQSIPPLICLSGFVGYVSGYYGLWILLAMTHAFYGHGYIWLWLMAILALVALLAVLALMALTLYGLHKLEAADLKSEARLQARMQEEAKADCG